MSDESKTLEHVANLAHAGGLADLSEHDVLVAIRQLTKPYWDTTNSPADKHCDVLFALTAARQASEL